MINNDSIDALEQAAPLSAAASPQHMAVPDGWRLFPAAAPQVVADERAAFVAHQRRADNIPEFITDDVIMAGEITNHQWAGWQARAALAAAPVQPVAVPDGWKLVPLDPTNGMIDALYHDGYTEMLDEAPAAPAAQGEAKELTDEKLMELAETYFYQIEAETMDARILSFYRAAIAASKAVNP